MDSEDYSTDEGKRKRDKGEDVFEKSKKIARTPTKTSRKSEEKLDVLIDLIRDLKEEVHQIRKEQEETTKEIKNIIKENEDLRKENAKIKKDNENIKEELTEVKDKLEWLEKEKRKHNVVMTGLQIDTDNTSTLKEAMKNMIETHLEVEVHIKIAHKLGERTCLIELENDQDKEKIMQNKHKLRRIKHERIYINEDLTKNEREKAKEIRQFAKQEKDKGRTVKIGYNKINVDGTEWRWNKNKRKLEPTNLNLPKN